MSILLDLVDKAMEIFMDYDGLRRRTLPDPKVEPRPEDVVLTLLLFFESFRIIQIQLLF